MSESKFFETHIGDGESSGMLDDYSRSEGELISRALELLDGGRWSAYVLWRGPDDAQSVMDVDESEYPKSFIQAAGTKDRMAIEWKTFEHGIPRQYAVGREHHSSAVGPTETVEFNYGKSRIEVFPDELFDDTEASRIFTYYVEHERPPAEFVLRDLHLPIDQTEAAS